jgi:hypothetical protein
MRSCGTRSINLYGPAQKSFSSMSNSLSQNEAKTMRPTWVRANVGSRISGSSASPMRSVVWAQAMPAQATKSTAPQPPIETPSSDFPRFLRYERD